MFLVGRRDVTCWQVSGRGRMRGGALDVDIRTQKKVTTLVKCKSLVYEKSVPLPVQAPFGILVKQREVDKRDCVQLTGT